MYQSNAVCGPNVKKKEFKNPTVKKKKLWDNGGNVNTGCIYMMTAWNNY